MHSTQLKSYAKHFLLIYLYYIIVYILNLFTRQKIYENHITFHTSTIYAVVTNTHYLTRVNYIDK